MENERTQTLKWLQYVPKEKVKITNMVMIIENGVPNFIPKHLFGIVNRA